MKSVKTKKRDYSRIFFWIILAFMLYGIIKEIQLAWIGYPSSFDYQTFKITTFVSTILFILLPVSNLIHKRAIDKKTSTKANMLQVLFFLEYYFSVV